MKRSESLDKLIPALAEVQGKLRRIAPTAKNPLLNSRYAPLADVWDAVMPTVQEAGLLIFHTPETAGETVTLDCTVMHVASQQFLTSTLPLLTGAESKGTSVMQRLGSAMTYARRATLTAMLGLVIADPDDDAVSAGSDWGAKERRYRGMLDEIDQLSDEVGLRKWWNDTKEERSALDPERSGEISDKLKARVEALKTKAQPTAATQSAAAPAAPKPRKKADVTAPVPAATLAPAQPATQKPAPADAKLAGDWPGVFDSFDAPTPVPAALVATATKAPDAPADDGGSLFDE